MYKKRIGGKVKYTGKSTTEATPTVEATTEEEAVAAVIDEEPKSESYEEFDGRPISGWEYDGDGRREEEFFRDHSNSDALISKMDRREREDFRDWTRGQFMSGQQYMGFSRMTAEDQRRTRTYDKILDQATLDKGITVVRRSTPELVLGKGRTTATLEELRAARGNIVTSKGSMSTGAAHHGLTIGSSSKRVEYRIRIPAGSKGAGMWVGDTRINGWGSLQREFMTNRDISFKVGKTRYVKSHDVYIVDLTYVGRQEHDYK